MTREELRGGQDPDDEYDMEDLAESNYRIDQAGTMRGVRLSAAMQQAVCRLSERFPYIMDDLKLLSDNLKFVTV